MASTVRIPFERDQDPGYSWTEVCARAIEMFGLPGDRFETHANSDHMKNQDYMEFVFKSNKDALMFALEHNGTIVPEEELTVELVGKYL